MAKNKSDLCMLCGEAPCACNKPVKKTSAKAVKKSVASKATPTVQEDATPDVFSDASIPDRKPKFVAPVTVTQTREEVAYYTALTLLREIVIPVDQRWIDKQLARNLPQEADRQLQQWKERHALRQQQKASE